VEKGSVDCFRYIVETAIERLHKTAIEHFGKSVAIAAAKGAQLRCLEVLHELKLPWDARATAAAARAGSKTCLQFLVKEGSVNSETLEASVDGGTLEGSVNGGTPEGSVNGGTPEGSVNGGTLEGSVDGGTLDAAVESGDKACLEVLKDQDWNFMHTAGLAFRGHLDGLNYLFSLKVWIA
jgi:hypothetical protein